MDFSMKRFMQLVGSSNWFFSVLRESSLAPLVTVLGGPYQTERIEDWRPLRTDDHIARVKIAICDLPADKRIKYNNAIQYLYGEVPRLKEAIGVHTNGTLATVKVLGRKAREDTVKHTVSWTRNGREVAVGTFLWNIKEQGTGWIEAKPERGGMGTFMVLYQAAALCKGPENIIRSGTPQGRHALAFRERLGFVLHRLGEHYGMEGDVATVLSRSRARCAGWRLLV